MCDSRMSIFLKSIEAAHSAEGQGFAGALCAPVQKLYMGWRALRKCSRLLGRRLLLPMQAV